MSFLWGQTIHKNTRKSKAARLFPLPLAVKGFVFKGIRKANARRAGGFPLKNLAKSV